MSLSVLDVGISKPDTKWVKKPEKLSTNPFDILLTCFNQNLVDVPLDKVALLSVFASIFYK